MKKMIPVLFLLLINIYSCSKDNPVKPKQETPVETNTILVDSLATPETVALFKNMQKVAAEGIMFGHQDDLAYGIGWWAEAGRSDVLETCGSYPAVYGWDLGNIGQTNNLDNVNFENMKKWIKEVYARGGVNTISLHLSNPVTGGNAWDKSPAVPLILPGKNKNLSYLKTWDKIADFLKELKTDNGVYIPIVLRPYHEHTQTWSWWGSDVCTKDEYNELWIMTVQYLRDHHKIHHVLYAISPQDVNTASAYFNRYPGDEWVDILALDYYNIWNKSDVPNLGKALALISTEAANRNKVAVLSETGIENVPITDWWTGYLLAAFNYNEDSKGIAYALVWRNSTTTHFFGPYPAHKSAADFKKFYNSPITLFENELPDMYH